jgi:hypothetical protein
MFFIFIKACKKYNFDFSLGTYGELTIVLKPKNTFENIEVKQKYYYNRDFNQLFIKAIRAMKRYREERGYYSLPRCSSDS